MIYLESRRRRITPPCGEKILQTVDRLAETSSIDTAREDFYQLYGSLLFVGIFFVSLFLIGNGIDHLL